MMAVDHVKKGLVAVVTNLFFFLGRRYQCLGFSAVICFRLFSLGSEVCRGYYNSRDCGVTVKGKMYKIRS